MHFDNWLFFLLVAVAMLFRWLASAASKAGKNSDAERRSTSTPRAGDQPIQRAPAQSDEERIRKFLEALGQPTTSKPPPPVVPRTDIPLRPVAPVQPPSARPFARPRRASVPKIITRIPIEDPKKKLVSVASPTFEVQTAPAKSPQPTPIMANPAKSSAAVIQHKTPSKPKEPNFATLLRSSAGLRDAVILREIFGPPRSLQPFDLSGSA